MRCDRCHDDVPELWGTIDMESRVGTRRAFDLCRPCTMVAYAFVLNRPLHMEDDMKILFPILDPDDMDDAEHPEWCVCAECDPDFKFEQQRDERADRRAS